MSYFITQKIAREECVFLLSAEQEHDKSDVFKELTTSVKDKVRGLDPDLWKVQRYYGASTEPCKEQRSQLQLSLNIARPWS